MTFLRADVALAFLDVCIVGVAYVVALTLRFNGSVPPEYSSNARFFIPLVAALYLLSNYLFGLYGQMWRYASVQEARRVVLAGVVGGMAAAVAAIALQTPGGWILPRSAVFIGAILALAGLGAVRFQSRLFAFRRRSGERAPARTLIVGAGRAGSMIVRDLLANPGAGIEPVGFVDDDPRKQGRAINGVQVLGAPAEIPELAGRRRVAQVLLAIPSADAKLVRDVAELCEKAALPLRVLPRVEELIGGSPSVRDVRDLRIEDLLGRRKVRIDLEEVGGILAGRRILVTGAGGSIGSEIARQVVRFGPTSIMLLDHDETHLRDLLTDLEVVAGDPAPVVRPELADIRDGDRIFELLASYRPHVVFHAAAHKHVDFLEQNPREAVLTNVMGTASLVDAAESSGVERFVFISSDKAVRPTSVMGVTKWFGEQIVRAAPSRGCVFCAVRFGNVLGSRGSVIPRFLRQIERGGPVTITDPEMRRYFMSIEEAVQLVLQASAISSGGEVLTLEMGEPVNIAELARKLIRLSGRVPDQDISIVYVGARPGEKLVEDIVDPAEETLPSAHPDIVVSSPPVPNPRKIRVAIREMERLVASDGEGDIGGRLIAIARTAEPGTPASIATLPAGAPEMGSLTPASEGVS